MTSGVSWHVVLRWPFFISPMGSFQRGMQIVKNWYGGQLDASKSLMSGHIQFTSILFQWDLHTVVKQGMQILSGSMGQPILTDNDQTYLTRHSWDLHLCLITLKKGNTTRARQSSVTCYTSCNKVTCKTVKNDHSHAFTK